MAVIHPNDLAHTQARREARSKKPLHPAWGLVGGFGLIVLAAVVVDLLFRLF